MLDKGKPDLAFRATMFYLNNKGKSRGYGYHNIKIKKETENSLDEVSDLELVSSIKDMLGELEIDETNGE